MENSTFYKLAGLMASFAEIKVVATMRDSFWRNFWHIGNGQLFVNSLQVR